MIFTDPYATHQPFLEWYIKKTSGDIIEFGVGNGSTGFILDLIKGTNRKLLSLENNKDWYNEIKNIYPPNDNHEYIFVNDWNEEIYKLDKNRYSIVFIDQNPWSARVTAMNYFLDSNDYILIHDVDYFPKNKLFGKIVPDTIKRKNTKKRIKIEPKFDFSDKFKNWKLYYPKKPWPCSTGPPTLVGSNKDLEIDEIELN
jgi:hypothetical protein